MTKNLLHLSYHIIVLLLSAAIALSIPHVFSALAENLLSFWAFIENEKMFLVSLEIGTAAGLIFFFNYVRQGWEARALSRLATSAGLVPVASFPGLTGRKPINRLKAAQGIAGDLMIIGSTGLNTFAAPEGELHQPVRNCRKAKIMLLNPFGEGAIVRAKSIPDPEITPEVIRDQIMESINFLKELRAGQKDIRLKLYPDMPLLKLAILDNHAFLRHYHAGLNVRKMPEYVFSSESVHGGIYLPLYRYFLSRWNDPDIPEYDLETDELVYRDMAGQETRREQFKRPDFYAKEGRKSENRPASTPGSALFLHEVSCRFSTPASRFQANPKYSAEFSAESFPVVTKPIDQPQPEDVHPSDEIPRKGVAIRRG